MHLHYVEEGKASTESNSPAEPVTTDHTASPPALAAEQAASGTDRGKKKKKRANKMDVLVAQKVQPEVWNALT